MFKIRQIVLFLAVGAAALLAGYFAGQWRDDGDVAPGGAASLVDITLPDSEGETRDIDEWRDKALLINFWATWCAPCREEIPELVKAQAEFGPRGFQVLGIAVDRPEPVRQYMAEMDFNYPSLVGESAGMDLMAEYGNPGSLPFTLAFDRQGNLVGKKLGRVSESEIRRFVDAMIPSS